MAESTRTDRYRPAIHFTPEKNWMNDPNGLVYYEGEYHLFYQYYPHGLVWGPMHWGHAVSKDMLVWEHLPIALYPDENGMIFSGSIVVDSKNSSGFFPDGQGLVALFTHADTNPETGKPRQRQSLAYSSDKGRTWTKYVNNPVLDHEQNVDFRDPKVTWHEPTNRWILVLVAGEVVKFYSSANLIDWQFESEFGAGQGLHGAVWECPDLIRLPIGNEPGSFKWVLLVSIGVDLEKPEGSRTQYFIGDFDGKRFTNENQADCILLLDHGRDNYAGVTWSNVTDETGCAYYIGWMSNWYYAKDVPADSFRSSMTIPRKIGLLATEAGIRLVQSPITALHPNRFCRQHWQAMELVAGHNAIFPTEMPTCYELDVTFKLGKQTKIAIEVRQSEDEKTVLSYDHMRKAVTVDRTHSGEVDFHPTFRCAHEVAIPYVKNELRLQVIVDTCSIEVFIADGRDAITDLIFPKATSDGISIRLDEGNALIQTMKCYDYSK